MPARLACFAVALTLITSPLAAQVYTDQTAPSGLVMPPYGFGHNYGRGGSWNDYDGDGDMDVFLAEGVGGDYVVWLNQGNGTFTKQVVLPDPGTLHVDHGVVSADFDNDGDADVFVTRGHAFADLLFVNQGNGTFVEEAALRGITHVGDGQSATWGDVDRDGWLDLYVGQYLGPGAVPGSADSPNVFYRNNGDGTFTDVTTASGLGAPSLNLCSLWLDFDQDGWLDMVIGNDKGSGLGKPVQFWRNNRNGSFTDVGPAINGNPPLDCMGIAVGDIHNDGDWDLFMTNIPFPGHCVLLWDRVTKSYQPQTGWADLATAYGLTSAANAWGTIFLDADQDGWLDLFYVHNTSTPKLHRGTGNAAAPFSDVSVSSGISTGFLPGFSCCSVDYDNDGDLDLFMPGDGTPGRLMRNDGATGNWLQVELQGTTSNRDGFGTVVIAKTAGGTFRRVKLSGEGFLSDGDKRLHFGLGPQSVVNELEIRWPSGTVQYLDAVAVNQKITVVESAFTFNGPLAPGTATSVTLDLPADAFIPYACGITLDVFSEYMIGDGRSVLVNVNDPLLVYTSTPGNSDFVDSNSFFDATGHAAMTLHLPNLPILTGLRAFVVGASWHPSYTSSIKSIVGPQPFVIN
ncbi:MAG: CRTAC1 family protein [Planctomycetota bacterium]